MMVAFRLPRLALRPSADPAPGAVHRPGPVSILCFSGFLALLLYRIATHSLWRDEAQHWLIAAAAKSPLDLLVLPGEGHPPLWYLICYLFASMDRSLWVLKLPTAICAVAALALLWFASRLRTWEKLLFSCSFYLSFQYAVLARGYALATVLLILFAVSFPRWRRHPFAAGCLLGAAALTHLYFVFVAGALCALTLLVWWRNAWSVRAAAWLVVPFAALAVASLASVFASAVPLVAAGHLAATSPSTWTAEIAARFVGTAFVQDASGFQPIVTLQWIAVVTLAAAAMRRLLPGLIFVACVAIITITHLVIFRAARDVSHAGVVFILFACWYLIDRSLLFRPAALLLLAASVAGGAVALQRDLTMPYSSGDAAAALIRAQGLQNADWIAYPDYTGTVTFAALGRSGDSLECDCAFTYIPWTRRKPISNPADLRDALARYVENHKPRPVYLLLSTPHLQMTAADLPAQFCLRRIGQTGPAFNWDEIFTLYKVSQRGPADCPDSRSGGAQAAPR